MRINGKGVPEVGEHVVRDIQKATPTRGVGAQHPDAAAQPKRDSVEISEAGRAKAATPAEVGPERLAEIRQRILSGAYDSVEILSSVAQKLLDRHDV